MERDQRCTSPWENHTGTWEDDRIFFCPRRQAIEESKLCQSLGLRPPALSTVRKLISVVLVRQKPRRLIVIIIAAVIL